MVVPGEGTPVAATDADLTPAERAANFDTMRHIERVRNLLNAFVRELLARGERHDQSKLGPPEVAAFTEFTGRLAACTYGSPEYEEHRRAMGPALAHHYANNRHHPEHHPNGVNDMTLADLVEMLCDWVAASARHADGDIRESIRRNTDRFGLSPQLAAIFRNTVAALGGGGGRAAGQ
jgi:hypothetical protein